MNLVIITGHLGLDPEIRFLPSGMQVARLRMAVNDYWFDKATGQKQTKTNWLTIKAFGRQAETCQNYLRKGSKLLVRGSLDYQEWTDRDGKKRNAIEIRMNEMEMLDRRDQAPAREEGQPARKPMPTQTPAAQGPSDADDYGYDSSYDPAPGAGDDDIPF